jgi:hypothetical protein
MFVVNIAVILSVHYLFLHSMPDSVDFLAKMPFHFSRYSSCVLCVQITIKGDIISLLMYNTADSLRHHFVKNGMLTNPRVGQHIINGKAVLGVVPQQLQLPLLCPQSIII